MTETKLTGAVYDKLYNDIIKENYKLTNELYYITSKGFLKSIHNDDLSGMTTEQLLSVISEMGRNVDDIIYDTQKRSEAGEAKTLRFVNDTAVNKIYDVIINNLVKKYENIINKKDTEIADLKHKITDLVYESKQQISKPKIQQQSKPKEVYITEAIREAVPQEESAIIGGDAPTRESNFTFTPNGAKLSTFEIPQTENDMIFRI